MKTLNKIECKYLKKFMKFRLIKLAKVKSPQNIVIRVNIRRINLNTSDEVI